MGKRSNGEGSVRRLKSGNWHGEIMDGYTDEGKRNIIGFTAPTKAEVLDKIREYKNERELHLKINKKMLFEAWADIWYADYESQVSASTYAGYKYTLNILKSELGTRGLSEIMVIDINRFFDKLAAKYSMSQIHKCRTMLIQIFDSADANGLVIRNPARKAKIIHEKDSIRTAKHEKDAFTEEEVMLLEKNLKGDLMGHSVRLMLGTGIRVQELLALSREDISEKGDMISVNKAIKTVNGIPELGPPKSKAGNRKIPVPLRYQDSARYLRKYGKTPHIWSYQGESEYYSVGCFRRRFQNVIKEIEGVRNLTPHCCRHTYVTRLQAMNVPMETIGKLVGHTSIDTTKEYTHISMDTLEKAAANLNMF